MKRNLSRRRFLGAGLLSGAGSMFFLAPGRLGAGAAEEQEGFCVTLCNHWSYTGIGWQLGIESDVLSVTDAMEMADRPPHVKTCINLDARAYEFMAEKFPEVTARLRKYLAAGKVELIGGTYGQPLGTMISGESNIRQIVYGRETIRKVLGYEMVTFLEEEEFSHPQVPQIALGADYRYASLAQLNTWGKPGIPQLELNAFKWQGLDGSAILSTPRNSLFGYSPNLKELAASDAFKKLRALGKPLIFTWEEFGWESPDSPAYLRTPEKYKKLADESPVEFVSLKDYLDKYGASGKETLYLNMDAWKKLLVWGIGGDQLRVMDSKVEAILLAAERFDALASSLGASSKTRPLDKAWKNLLASQSHDVSLCEYTRWSGAAMAPLDRIEDYHNITWGSLGYNLLDAAEKQGREVLDSSLRHVAGRIGSEIGKQGQFAVTVFNPCAWERTEVASTGRIYPLHEKARDIVVKDGSGRTMPSQIVRSEKDEQGNLIVADVAFLAENVPSVGYDTYYLELAPETSVPAATDLRIDEEQLELENKYLKVKLSPKHGAIVSLIDKRTGREMFDAEKSAFPVLKGTPNQDYHLGETFVNHRHQDLAPPAFIDSSQTESVFGSTKKSSVFWIEKGPLRATAKAQHNWPLLNCETRVTLSAGLPWVEVTTRIVACVPPARDEVSATDNRFPVEIKQGYWLTFAPSFQPESVVRDYPLGIEPTDRQFFHARTFVDLVGKDAGMLVLHPGTQYFKRNPEGVFSNLVVREWESFWSGEYGWPRYSEYRHALLPHAGNLTNRDRLRAAEGFNQKLITVVSRPQSGNLPRRKAFVTLAGNAHLLAFRKKERQGYELRVEEIEGRKGRASVGLAIPVARASETNLVGRRIANAPLKPGKLEFDLQPWKIRTFEIL